MEKTIRGSGKPIIGIVGCLHGDEKVGKQVINMLKRIPKIKGTIILILANTEAMIQNKRFIDYDLNRSFPGKEDGNHEERIAKIILDELKDCDFVIDIHSTKADTPNFIITTKSNFETIRLAQYVPLEKIVIMNNLVADGKSLIDHTKCGISIEFNSYENISSIDKTILKFLNNIWYLKETTISKDHKIYLVYDVLRDKSINTSDFCNFKKIILKRESFYPILYGEKEYPDLICLKAERII